MRYLIVAAVLGVMSAFVVNSMVNADEVVSEELLNCIAHVESNNNPDAVSPAGAIGVYQWLPSSAAQPGYGIASFIPGVDPELDREKTRQYLEGMMDHHNFSLTQALQAYNWGPGNILSGGELPTETKNYTVKIASCLKGD